MAQTIQQEIDELQRAITTLEGQRAVLGDEAIDAAVAGLRQKLDGLKPSGPERHRKLVTILSADVKGFTAMSERMDPEDVNDVMNTLWRTLDTAIMDNGGTIDKHIGDAVLAVWGADQVREDDPERAILAALRMQEELGEMAAGDPNFNLQMRIGLNTGQVLLGEVGSTGEFAAVGETVNTANRLQEAAAPGGVLISHDSYRHVLGVFDVEEGPTLQPGGKVSIRTYVVQDVKPNAFRIGSRGVEGVETQMIGRDAELGVIKDRLFKILRSHKAHIITIVGEAGMGKSRLLHETVRWVELLPINLWFFQGRARPQLRGTPFSLLRDVLSNRFEIQDNDSASIAREKLVRGIQRFLGEGPEAEEKAQFIGHMVGFDFSGSPALSGLVDNADQIRGRAFQYLAQFFRAANNADGNPIVIFLEDCQWADAGSMAVFESIVEHSQDSPIFILMAAREALFERNPEWGQNGDYHSRVTISGLDIEQSRALVRDILQKVKDVPDVLIELIAGRAEGNPFYVEELIKMLIEDGVIRKGDEEWSVRADKLVNMRVPDTLTGVLQARLDSLPTVEKAVLQRAAVVGRIFWDSVVMVLGTDVSIDPEAINEALANLIGRELVFPHDASAFAGAREFIFKNAILHQVTYDSVLRRMRRGYHRQIAEWLVQQSGERASENIELIADHYNQAGDIGKAIEYLDQAGRQALQINAFRDAVDSFEKALEISSGALASELLNAQNWQARLQYQTGRAYHRLGDFARAHSAMSSSLDLAREIDDKSTIARALTGLGTLNEELGNYGASEKYLTEALELGRELDDQTAMCSTLISLGNVKYRTGDYDQSMVYLQEALPLAREIGDNWRAGTALHAMGFVVLGRGDFSSAIPLFEEALSLQESGGDLIGISDALNGLGASYHMLGALARAHAYYQRSLESVKEIGTGTTGYSRALINLGEVALDMQNYGASRQYLIDALGISWKARALPQIVTIVFDLGRLLASEGNKAGSLELVSMARQHPSGESDLRASAEAFIAKLRDEIPPEEFEEAVETGKTLDLETVVEGVLAPTE